jgi:hypothetical protein
MIKLVPSDYDDSAFLLSAQRIVNGAVAAPEVRKEQWKVADERRISRRELASFEEFGRRLEPVAT